MVSIPRLVLRRPRVSTLTATDGRDIVSLNSPAGWEVTQPWLWFTNAPNGADNVWGNPPPGAYDNPNGAVSLPAVTRCTSIITETIAGMPWQVFRGWERLDTPNWISDPQALRQDGRVFAASMDAVKLSAVEFWTEWLVSALWFGDGYLWTPVRGADGQPQPPIWVINPRNVAIDGGQYYVTGSNEPIPAEQIIHLRGLPPYKDGHGAGVLTRHGLDLALALTVRQYAGSQYQSGIPYGYIKSTQPRMDGEQAQALKDKWMQQHGNATRDIAVLNSTTEFVPLSISPLDAQLEGARQWSLRDVAMAFGVPAYMLGVPGDSSTYANVESRMIELRQFTLLPWIRRVESTLDAQFPRGTELEVNTDALLRADTMSRANALKIMVDTGIMTRDEARAKENLPPLGVTADTSLPDNHPGIPPTDTNVNPPLDTNPQTGAVTGKTL